MNPKTQLFLFCAVLGLLSPALGAQQAPAWRQALGGAVIGAPAAQAESVVAICDGGTVEAYSRQGIHLWSFNARGRLSPYLTRSPEGTSYVCRTNGLLIALNRIGREVWRVSLGSPITAPVLVGWDGRIFVPTATQIACYTASGFLLWSKPLNGALALKPQPDKLGGLLTVRSDGQLLILGPYGNVISRRLNEVPAAVLPLDAAAAKLLAPGASRAAVDIVKAAAEEAAKLAAEAKAAAIRAKEAADRAAAAAAAAPANNGAQTAAKSAEEAAVVAALNAAEKTRAAEEAAARRPPVFRGDEQTVLVIYKNGQAESIRWYNDGESAFAASFPSLGSAPLAAVNREDTIGAAMANGKVLLFSSRGRALWSVDSPTGDSSPEAAANTSLLYDERGIYALTRNGAAGYGIDGKQLWTLPTQGTASPPAFSDEGILYSGGSDWVLYAYHMEDTVKIRKQSIYGPAAEGSYSNGDPRPSPWAADNDRYEPAVMGERLALISTAIRNGQVGARERDYTAYLMEVAGSLAEAPMNQSLLHPLVHVHYRVEAARLLSYIGSRETVPFLADLCRNDPDSVVKSTAAEAIGYIGVDPEGTAFTAFTYLIFPLAPTRDERLMAAIAVATGSLCRFSGPPLSETGTRLLTALASLGPSFAQAVARKELHSLYY
ncbi:PQQ-binding-like beta-propeller repeat protein [Treponema primitia]|uniref:outer membrane protein assembly factor BamB family protein n=1 Tax=Treponema primitia TaxID=88058 RepID=UPI000C1F983F|nr:PQQ-binding-like beta-propeller repeat protein [Treponema primitia]